MADTVPTIRNFNNAPVIETVLSIQFKPIPGFTIPHFGLYWKGIRDEFKHCEIKNPIVHMIENFQTGPAQRFRPLHGPVSAGRRQLVPSMLREIHSDRFNKTDLFLTGKG